MGRGLCLINDVLSVCCAALMSWTCRLNLLLPYLGRTVIASGLVAKRDDLNSEEVGLQLAFVPGFHVLNGPYEQPVVPHEASLP